MDVKEYLKAVDPATLPRRRGRSASTFYPDLVDAFVESGEAAMEVDVKKIGRKPETVRSALAKTIRTKGLQRKAGVSIGGGRVFLVKR